MTDKLTTEQVVGLYKDVELKFSDYYKYSFNYRGYTSEGYTISASFGGSSEDIYRHAVSNDDIEKGGDIINDWMYLEIRDSEEVVIYEYHDY